MPIFNLGIIVWICLIANRLLFMLEYQTVSMQKEALIQLKSTILTSLQFVCLWMQCMSYFEVYRLWAHTCLNEVGIYTSSTQVPIQLQDQL